MSPRGLSQKKLGNKSIKEALMPLYYRHEFARRNEGVVNGAQEVLKLFPWSATMLSESGFLDVADDEPKTFADWLLEEFRNEPNKTKKKSRRDALGRYMREWRVLPVPPPPTPFFPKALACERASGAKDGPGQQKAENPEWLFVIWRSLVGFERFLLAEGMTEEPCFMPVVPLNLFHGTKGVHDLDSERLGKISEHRLILALDSTHAHERLATHLEMLLGQLDVLARLRQGKDSMPGATERIPWQSFDLYLEVADFLTLDKSKNEKEQALVFHESTNRETDEDTYGMAVINFKRWKKETIAWKKGYKQIS